MDGMEKRSQISGSALSLLFSYQKLYPLSPSFGDQTSEASASSGSSSAGRSAPSIRWASSRLSERNCTVRAITLVKVIVWKSDFLRNHDEIVFVQAFYDVHPPGEIHIARFYKILVAGRQLKGLIARNHKHFVNRPLGNFLTGRNHKILFPPLVG
jgi:hypothetical protein